MGRRQSRRPQRAQRCILPVEGVHALACAVGQIFEEMGLGLLVARADPVADFRNAYEDDMYAAIMLDTLLPLGPTSAGEKVRRVIERVLPRRKSGHETP